MIGDHFCHLNAEVVSEADSVLEGDVWVDFSRKGRGGVGEEQFELLMCKRVRSRIVFIGDIYTMGFWVICDYLVNELPIRVSEL